MPVLVARHGETTWNLAGRYQGRLESALSARGVRQGFALAALFAERLAAGASVPERIITSPLLRCTATARLVAERLGISVEIDPRLVEIAHGTWEGRYREEIAANDPARYRAWREDPKHVAFDGGESLADVRARWEHFQADALDDRPTLVVTHDAVVRCALLTAAERDLDDFWQVRVRNGAFATFARDGNRLAVIMECEDTHLVGIQGDRSETAM